jgi:O-antigen/teichoic acid export membrane protein
MLPGRAVKRVARVPCGAYPALTTIGSYQVLVDRDVLAHPPGWLHMIRSGLILTSGNAAAALLSLVRNVVIARLIGMEDFGIASTFAITMALVEMASNFSLHRLVVQARDGDAPRLLSTLHAVQAIRGVLGAGVLVLVAGPVAALFGVPEVAWAYRALALIPLLRGLAHLDMFRRQRAMQFGPSATVEVAAQTLSCLAALPLALWLGDWRAMLYALLMQQIVFTAASHAVAMRPYRWTWDREVIGRTLRFGLPLLANGILMFAIFQGDRIIVGSLIGMTELGWFSVAFSLTFMPAMVLAVTLQSFFLPQLARVQDDAAAFRRLYLVTMQACLLLGLGLAVVLWLAGPMLVVLLYGARYALAAPIVVWLAIMQGLRIARIGASITATAKANTTNPLLANVARIMALPIAWGAVSMGGGVTAVVGIAIAGECVALVVSQLLLRRRLALPLRAMCGPGLAAAATCLLVGLDAVTRGGEAGPGAPAWLGAAVLGMTLVTLWSMRSLRKWSREVVVEALKSRARGTDV